MGRNNGKFIKGNATPDTIVKEWYHKAYPTDDEWKSLETFTFMDLFNLLDNNYGPDFGDSILRGRIFQELAYVMDADYNYVYDQWLNSENDINMTKYDFGILNFSDFQNGMSIRENFNGYKQYNMKRYGDDENGKDVYYQFYYTLDELYCDGELTLEDLRNISKGISDELLNAMLIKITADIDGDIVDTNFSMSRKNKRFYERTLRSAAKNYLIDLGIKESKSINESWYDASEEDVERFRAKYNSLKSDTKRKHKWLDFPRSAEEVIANNQDKVADQVFDFIESHKQYFAPDSGIYNGKFFYIEKKFNKGMGRTRLCKIDPKTKTIYLTNVANRFDIKYLEESFPKYKIEKDDKYSPWDRKSW